MAGLHLVPDDGPSWVELVATKIADGLMVAGQRLHSRWAVAPASSPDEWWEWSEQWRQALAGFVTWSAPLDFSRQRTLRAGICSRTDYERCMLVLKRMGVVIAYPKSGHAWAHGWSKRRFLSELRRREVEAPYPVGLPAPVLLHTRRLENQMSQPSQARHLGSTTIFANSRPQAATRLERSEDPDRA